MCSIAPSQMSGKLDAETEEEQRDYAAGLMLIEPRPLVGASFGGIFEVLESRA